MDMIKDKIKQFMMNNKGRWVVVNQIVDYINNHSFNKKQHNDTTYYEVYSILKKKLNYSWRKASQLPPRWFQESLQEARNIFKQFILKLKDRKFLIVGLMKAHLILQCYLFIHGYWNEKIQIVLLETVQRYIMWL